MSNGPLTVKAWIQMGCERREVRFEVSTKEIEEVGLGGLEAYIEDVVEDWTRCRFGWGWSCEGFQNDFSFLEDGESASLVDTNEVLNPRTRRVFVPSRTDRMLRGRRWIRA